MQLNNGIVFFKLMLKNEIRIHDSNFVHCGAEEKFMYELYAIPSTLFMVTIIAPLGVAVSLLK